MKQLNQFLRATIVLCGLAAGLLAVAYQPAPAWTQVEKKCYFCECTTSCSCVEVQCKPAIPE
jgi:hypothetical protein